MRDVEGELKGCVHETTRLLVFPNENGDGRCVGILLYTKRKRNIYQNQVSRTYKYCTIKTIKHGKQYKNSKKKSYIPVYYTI